MERVADIFDRNGDGFIDSKEYIDTLRPEKEVYGFSTLECQPKYILVKFIYFVYFCLERKVLVFLFLE